MSNPAADIERFLHIGEIPSDAHQTRESRDSTKNLGFRQSSLLNVISRSSPIRFCPTVLFALPYSIGTRGMVGNGRKSQGTVSTDSD